MVRIWREISAEKCGIRAHPWNQDRLGATTTVKFPKLRSSSPKKGEVRSRGRLRPRIAVIAVSAQWPP